MGYFVRPTIIESSDPTDQMFSEEYFGPILAVHVYEDDRFEQVVDQMESFAPYALTGAIIAQDRAAIAWARKTLRFAAGNFYINDKPTGAVVGQQPFGGARASGTNDKAGPRSTCCAGPRRAPSRRRSCRRRTTATPTRAERPRDGWEDGRMTTAVLPLHMGALHPVEQALTLLLAFGPLVVLGLVLRRATGELRAEDEAAPTTADEDLTA